MPLSLFTSGSRRPLTAPRRSGSCWAHPVTQPPGVQCSYKHRKYPNISQHLSGISPHLRVQAQHAEAACCSVMPKRGAVSTLPLVVSLGLGGWLGDGSTKPNGESATKEGSSTYNPEQIKLGNPKSLFMPFCRTICWDSLSTFFPCFKVPKFPPLQGGRETRILLQFCLGD